MSFTATIRPIRKKGLQHTLNYDVHSDRSIYRLTVNSDCCVYVRKNRVGTPKHFNSLKAALDHCLGSDGTGDAPVMACMHCEASRDTPNEDFD